jgi:hypothetical protein
MSHVQPGYAFSIVCDLGFAVGLATHLIPRIGTLVWMAEEIYDDEPQVKDAHAIEKWRWPVFFPLGAAARRRLIQPIGLVPIPPQLRDLPVFRGGNRQMGWTSVTFDDAGTEIVIGPAADPRLPINQIVNDTALKEMLVSGWRPEADW